MNPFSKKTWTKAARRQDWDRVKAEWKKAMDEYIAKEASRKAKQVSNEKKETPTVKKDDFEYLADAIETKKKEDIKKFGVPWDQLSTGRKVGKVFKWIGIFALLSLVITPLGAVIVVGLYGASRVTLQIVKQKQEKRGTHRFTEFQN